MTRPTMKGVGTMKTGKMNFLTLGVILMLLLVITASELHAAVELQRFTRFGGSGSDRVTAMISDRDGNVFITGSTKSNGLATPGAFQVEIAGVGFTGGDAYVAKLDGSTLAPIWVTYLVLNQSLFGVYGWLSYPESRYR